MANPLDPIFSPFTSGPAAPPLPTAEDYATQIRQAGLSPRQGFVQEPELPTGRTARLAYSPSTKQFFVGGYTFDDDNDTAAVALSKYANQEAPLPEGDWQEIDPASYAQYVEGIRSPGFFQQIANNFDIGLDEAQQTLGYGLMFAGATEMGARLADQSADLAKTQIYQRSIENIGENGVLDWVAATIGRLGPNIIESVITAGIGAGIGSAATPAGTAGGAVLGFFGKSAVKKALYEAAKKHFKGQALDAAEKKLLLSSAGMLNAASNAAKTKLAPGAFNQFMEEGLQAGAENIARRVAARAPTEIGAVGLSTASNIFQQTGQAYGETMADGGEGNRAVALGVGALGGIADTAGEFLLAGRVFSEAMGDVAGSITKRKKALNILKSVGAGAGVGAGMEGGTEAFQEVLQLAANPVVDVNTAEGQSRLLNAFAGGALLGGGFGGAGGIFAGSLADNKQEANLLLPVAKTDPGYAQYLLDVKKQLGEAEYNKVFGPPQPYTNIMAQQGAQEGVTAQQASADAEWQRLFGYVPATRMQSFPPPAPPFAAPTEAQPQGEMFPGAAMGTAPAAPPVAAPPAGTPDMLAQGDLFAPPRPPATLALPPASTVYVPPTGPEQIYTRPDYIPPSPTRSQGALLLRGGKGQAPARVPTGPTPQLSREAFGSLPVVEQKRRLNEYNISARRFKEPELTMGEFVKSLPKSTDMGGVQGALQPQKEPPAPPPPTNAMQSQLERLKRDMGFEQARRQAAATRVTPAERVYTEATIDQPITLDVDAVISPDKLGKKLTPNERDRRKILAGFNTLTQPQQNLILDTFDNDEAQLIAYVRREKPSVVVKQFATLAQVNENTFKVNIPKPLKREEKNATKPGARAEGAKPAGERAGKNRGAGEGDNLRAGAEDTETQAQPAAAQPAARSETLREEAGGAAKLEAKKPVVVEKKPPRRTLKKPTEPKPPKAEGEAAPSAKTAEKPPVETNREVWDEFFADGGVGYDSLSGRSKGKWRKLLKDKGDKLTTREADAFKAQYVKEETPEVKKYEDLSEDEVSALASDVKTKATLLADDKPGKPVEPARDDKPTTKAARDLYEVYSAVSTTIKARRLNKAAASLTDKQAAKLDFMNSVGFMYQWVTDPQVHPTASNAARAYLEAYVSTDETLPGVKQAIKDARSGNFMRSEFDAVTNPVDENGRPAKGVNPIRVKAIVDRFRSGLAKAPKFFVYKNQADLQSRNPELYQRAVAARPQGDFDTAMASGYAFDGTVLVFTDRIPTEKYMRFLLAHEAIGHFGMRSLLPAKQFDALMDYVYDNNPSVRQSVDGALKGSKDLGARREAVEEYMAKFAEKLDSSILRRVWSAIKDVLNKLGVKFEDDIVRYLVSQARSTVRNGSSMFTPSTFALNVQTVMTNNGTGRFSVDPVYSAQHTLRNQLDLMATPPANIEETGNTLRDLKIDGLDKFENFMRNVFRLRNFNALRNHGAQIAERLKDAMRTGAQSLYNTYNERLAKLLALTGNSRQTVSYAMVISRRIASSRFKLDENLRNKALLVLGDERLDGSGRDTTVDEDVLKQLLALGTLSKKELEDGAEITYEEAIEGGKTKKVTVKVKGLQEELGRGLTDEEYDIYVQTRKDLADLDIERLKAQFDNFFLAEKVSTKGINKVLADKEMTADDGKFVRDIVNHAKKLFVDDMEYDERGMPDVTTKTAMRMEQFFKAVNTAIVKKEFTDDLKKDVREFYANEKQAEAAIKKIEDFRSRRTEFSGLEEQSVIYTVQDRVKEIVLADAAFERAQMFVRRSIASSHVPLWREGKFQVRVEAQINGRTVQLHPDVQNKMIYSLAPKLSEAENQAAFYNDKMKDIEYSGLVRDDATGEYKTQTFKVFARASKTVDTVSSDPSIDIDNFLYTMRVLGIPLAPDKHAKAITMLTAPGSALRKSLKFDDTPGYDASRTVEAVARHVTTRSSLIVKTRFQPLLRDLMDQSSETGKKWFGDKEAVITAKERLDAATDQKQKDYWQDRLTKELYMYVTTNPGAKGWDGSRSTFNNQPTKASLGMRYYSDTSAEFDAINDAPNISESTFEGKRYAALAKMVTSIGFLGGMFTQFAQNLMSPATNVLPYLASKDSQTGFGGGFGIAVIPTYLKAFKDVVGVRGMNPFSDPIEDAKAFEKVANEIKAARDAGDTAKEAQLVQQYSLSYYEALNIAREIREGKLIPAQANSLLETARGIFTGKLAKGFLKFSDVYMAPFNVSEQATRRATFLTAFRLEFNRLKEAGFNEDKASEMARLFAIDTVDKTLGEYSNTNRPPVWRDGVMSLLFVYKTYPLTSLLLFKNLSRAGKIGMLTSLYVLAGAAGFPLVDDIEDLIDTLSQRFGLDLGQGPAVRMAIVRQLEEFFPGWSDLILRGPMNHYTGADVGAKFGLEDFLPGTGIFLKGANTTEELKSIAGPVIGMGLSMGNFLYDLGRAPLSSTTSLLDVTREAPISLVRAIGDSVAYMQNGAIVDRRGYIVSPEVSAMTVASRILGFYPADAARQYDFIKYANRMNYDYKEVGIAYRMAWVKAMMTGDRSQAARIVREVNDWNEANKGGPGVIRNFLRNAQKALQEARRPAGERFLKSAPVASRASYDRFMGYIAPE